MRSKWANKHIELPKICSAAKTYFEERDFQVEERSKSNRCELIVSGKSPRPSLKLAVIDIYSDSREVTVDYYPGGDRKSSFHSRVFDSVMMMLGGGFLVWQDQKKHEFLDELENDFWKFMDEFFEKID